MAKLLAFIGLPAIAFFAMFIVLAPVFENIQYSINSIRDADLYYEDVSLDTSDDTFVAETNNDIVMDVVPAIENVQTEIQEITPNIDIQQIMLDGDTQIYWGENESIGDNFFLINVSGLLENPHAIQKHGIKAVATWVCLGGKNRVMELTRKSDGRKAVICRIDINELLENFSLSKLNRIDPRYDLEKLNKLNGKLGVGIFESDGTHQITLFIKENLNSVSEVVKYLNDCGYFR